jgi:hypothetical protein
MVAPICPTICAPGGAGGGVYSGTKISTDTPFTAPSLAGAIVPFDTVDFDLGPAIEPDLANDALVVQQGGIYAILATHTWEPGGSTNTISIEINGVQEQLDSAENPSIRAGSLSVLVELDAGDVIQLRAFSSDGTGVLAEASLAAEKRN